MKRLTEKQLEVYHVVPEHDEKPQPACDIWAAYIMYMEDMGRPREVLYRTVGGVMPALFARGKITRHMVWYGARKLRCTIRNTGLTQTVSRRRIRAYRKVNPNNDSTGG